MFLIAMKVDFTMFSINTKISAFLYFSPQRICVGWAAPSSTHCRRGKGQWYALPRCSTAGNVVAASMRSGYLFTPMLASCARRSLKVVILRGVEIICASDSPRSIGFH